MQSSQATSSSIYPPCRAKTLVKNNFVMPLKYRDVRSANLQLSQGLQHGKRFPSPRLIQVRLAPALANSLPAGLDCCLAPATRQNVVNQIIGTPHMM